MSGFKFITAKKRGKSRIAKSTFKSVIRTLKTVPPPLVDIKEVEQKPPTIATLPQIQAGNIPYLTYLECKEYGEKNDDMICNKIRTEMGMDLSNKPQGQTDKDVKDLYSTFIRRYMRFLKFRNSVTTQFTTDAHFHIEDCSLVINDKFRNFMNFDISIASVMRRFEHFVETDMETIEEIVDKQGNSRLDKLYQLLFNQVLINTAPYYEYIIQLLETHEKIRRDLIKTIGRAQENLKKNIEIMKKIKIGDTISEEVRQMIVSYLIRMNPKGKIMFNKRITKDEMGKIKSIIDIYEKYCTDKIINIFDASLEIQDVNDTIKLLKAQLNGFNELYESELEAIKDTHAKDIFKQFLTETREYYRDASSSASRSIGSMPKLVDATSVPIGAPPSIAPPPVLPAPPPQPSQVMTNEDAINTLMNKFFK